MKKEILAIILIIFELLYSKELVNQKELHCSSKTPRECYSLALLYDRNGSLYNPKKAIRFYTKGCDYNHPESCDTLGVIYALEKDYNKSKFFYNKACSLEKSTVGCAGLGLLYEQGTGVKQNYKKAINLYQKACNNNEAMGCNNLGLIYKFNNYQKPKYDKALVLLKKACDLNYSNGCNNLGHMYIKGLGIKQNNLKAYILYKKSCDLNNSLGCYGLGIIYFKGIYVKKDIVMAKKTFKKSCQQGFNQSCIVYQSLK